MNDPARTDDKSPAPTPLEIMARRSRTILLAERLLRLGAGLGVLVLAFLSLSWSGLWLEVGAPWRILGVALFAQAALFLVAREILRGPPSRRLALQRLDDEDASGLRPATSLEDRLAGDAPEPATATLWELHRRRLERAVAALPVAPPRPDLPRRDPFALRALALVAATAMAFVAGDDKTTRLRAAFDWRGAGASFETARFDAYIDPPPYTGRPSLVLEDRDIGQTREAPINSVLHLRFAGAATTEGALAPMVEPRDAGKATGPATDFERKFKLTGAARLVLPDGRGFDLAAIPDHAPSIEPVGAPRNNSRGTMTLRYKTDDDYGVIEARALLSRPGARRALYPPPQPPLTPPPENNGRGETRATLDLSDSPWAGANATLTLEARDEGGNVGRSRPLEITLPQRRFTKPLARALAEQRRVLAMDPENRAQVRLALDALSIAPELFDTPASIHLGLRAARRGLDGPRSDDELREVAELLWAMALSVEGGDVAQSERDAREAQRKLREALARGADDKEIEQLTSELRDAMAKFLQDLSQQAARQNDPDAAKGDGGEGQEVSQQDLDKLLDEMDEASKSGDVARAQKLLDELANVLENLQPSQGGKGSGKSSRARENARSELDQLSRDQQRLRDETFQGAAPENGSPEERSSGGGQAGRDRQHGLRERLERQREALRRSGETEPSELGDADKAMKDAEQALGQGASGTGKAVEAQGRALQALRRGGDELARRGEEQGGEGEQGARREGGKSGRDGTGSNQDPLGRAMGQKGDYDLHSRYDPLGLPPAQRARRVQEEVRRRLSQPARPAEELDYLQRLLRR